MRVEGNLLGVGDGFPNTSRVLVEYGRRTPSSSSGQGRIDGVKINLLVSFSCLTQIAIHYSALEYNTVATAQYIGQLQVATQYCAITVADYRVTGRQTGKGDDHWF